MDDEVRDCLDFGTYIKYIKTAEKPKQTANAFTVLMSSMATRKQPSEKNGEDNKSKLYNPRPPTPVISRLKLRPY